jgi:hypothetical protein
LHLLQFIIEVEDNSHLIHKSKSKRERPLPGALTIRLFSSGNNLQCDRIDEIIW